MFEEILTMEDSWQTVVVTILKSFSILIFEKKKKTVKLPKTNTHGKYLQHN